MDTGKIKVRLSQDKIDRITSVYQGEQKYWKEAALKNLDKNDANKLKDLGPPSLFLTHEATKNVKNIKKMNIDEIIHYLKPQYSYDENQIDHIQRHSGEHFLERILEEMKVISKYVKETENMSLKNNILFGEWFLNARSRYKYIKNKDSPKQFDKWVHKECGIVKQTMYNYINLYKLVCIAQKLCVCRVNMTYFIISHKTLMTYFKNAEKTPWKHQSDCKCNDCNVYFFGMEF